MSDGKRWALRDDCKDGVVWVLNMTPHYVAELRLRHGLFMAAAQASRSLEYLSFAESSDNVSTYNDDEFCNYGTLDEDESNPDGEENAMGGARCRANYHGCYWAYGAAGNDDYLESAYLDWDQFDEEFPVKVIDTEARINE